MKTCNNRIIVDLKKVQWARFYYKNQWGQTRDLLPRDNEFTSHNLVRYKDEMVFRESNYTMYQMALDKEILDVWIPTLYLQLTSNHSLTYTSDKALSLYKAWQAYIFKHTGKETNL